MNRRLNAYTPMHMYSRLPLTFVVIITIWQYRAVFTWLSKVIEELVWFWFYYALWLASVFTLVLVLRQSSENRSRILNLEMSCMVCSYFVLLNISFLSISGQFFWANITTDISTMSVLPGKIRLDPGIWSWTVTWLTTEADFVWGT